MNTGLYVIIPTTDILEGEKNTHQANDFIRTTRDLKCVHVA